jgi:hypothetical protein
VSLMPIFRQLWQLNVSEPSIRSGATYLGDMAALVYRFGEGSRNCIELDSSSI